MNDFLSRPSDPDEDAPDEEGEEQRRDENLEDDWSIDHGQEISLGE